MTAKPQHILDSELVKHQKALEQMGAIIEGYSGGSPEGDIWQYSFHFKTSLSPDYATATIRIYWRYGWTEEPENEMQVYRKSAIFREGSASSYENAEKYSRTIIGNDFNLAEIITVAMQACKAELAQASDKVINFAP